MNCALLSPGDCAGYVVCVNQVNPTGPEFCCEGNVYKPEPGDLVAKLADPFKPVVAAVGEPTTAVFRISNPSTAPLVTDLHLFGSLGAIDFGQGVGSSSHSIPVSLQPGEEQILQIPITLNARVSALPHHRYPFELFAGGRRVTTSVVLVAPPRANAPGFAIVAFEADMPANEARILVQDAGSALQAAAVSIGRRR